MSDSDGVVLDQVLEIRVLLADIGRALNKIEATLDTKADAARVDRLATKLVGLTHMTECGFESIIQRLRLLDQRFTQLESERA